MWESNNIYDRLLLKFIKELGLDSKIHTLQDGFRAKRGILEQLGMLRVISEYLKEKKHLVFDLYGHSKTLWF